MLCMKEGSWGTWNSFPYLGWPLNCRGLQ